MDEQYIEENEQSGVKKDNHHLTLVLATVIILIVAAVFIFIARNNQSQEPVVVEDNLPVTEETPVKQLSAEEEAVALAEFNAQLALMEGEATEGSTEAPVEANALPPGPSLPSLDTANTPGLVSCFDYYKFGSVQVDMAPYFEESWNGDGILFGGNITNNNPYPVVDGQIYMKVFKVEDNGFEKFMEDGYPLVDFVLMEDNVNLPASSTKAMEFEWRAPADLAKGDYMATFFFTTSYRYNLLGLSFTDDVTGNKSNFTINRDEDYQPVVFDKHSVSLNDKKHRFALPAWSFAKEEKVVAYATLVNVSDEPRAVDVVWNAYQWDGILASNKKDTKIQRVDVPAKGEVEIAYQTPTLDTAVTFVTVTANEGDATSTLHIRYVRDGIAETRINYPSLFSYPLKAGEEATLFSCVHSTNLPLVNDNTLTLTLSDDEGNTVHQYTYNGDITGEMMGLKDSFTPKKDLVNLTLNAKLTQAGEVVEDVTIKYKCADIDPELCALEPDEVFVTEDNKTTNPTIIIITIVLLLLVLGGTYFLTRKKTLTSANQ